MSPEYLLLDRPTAREGDDIATPGKAVGPEAVIGRRLTRREIVDFSGSLEGNQRTAEQQFPRPRLPKERWPEPAAQRVRGWFEQLEWRFDLYHIHSF